MRTTPNRSGAEPALSKPVNTKPPDIAAAPVPETRAALQVNPDTGLTRAEVDARHAANRALAGASFAMAIREVVGRLLGLAAEG
jgi:hypothetical protein